MEKRYSNALTPISYIIFSSDYFFQRFCNIWVFVTPSDNSFTISPHNLARLHSTLLHSYPVPLKLPHGLHQGTDPSLLFAFECSLSIASCKLNFCFPFFFSSPFPFFSLQSKSYEIPTMLCDEIYKAELLTLCNGDPECKQRAKYFWLAATNDRTPPPVSLSLCSDNCVLDYLLRD